MEISEKHVILYQMEITVSYRISYMNNKEYTFDTEKHGHFCEGDTVLRNDGGLSSKALRGLYIWTFWSLVNGIRKYSEISKGNRNQRNTDYRMLKRECFKNILESLKEIDKFRYLFKLPNWEETKILNRIITKKEVETLIKSSPTK